MIFPHVSLGTCEISNFIILLFIQYVNISASDDPSTKWKLYGWDLTCGANPVNGHLAYELFLEYEFARRLQEKNSFIVLSVHLSGF